MLPYNFNMNVMLLNIRFHKNAVRTKIEMEDNLIRIVCDYVLIVGFSQVVE